MKFIYISKGESEDEQVVSGIAYQSTPPELESMPYLDSQNEWVKMSELEKGAHAYLANSGGLFNINHEGHSYRFPILESAIIEEDTEKWGHKIFKGAWLLTLSIDDDSIWAMIKNNSLNGFSIQGIGMAEVPQ